MKITILFAATVLLHINSFCQTKFIGEIKKIPMIAGEAYGVQYNIYRCCGHPSLTIRSVNSDVFSISSATVKAVLDMGESIAIVVKGEDQKFYAYTSLDTIYFSKGNYIKSGDLMGKSLINTEENLFEINFMIVNEKGNYLSEDKIWDLIEQANIVPIAAVCDAVAAQ